MKNGILLLIAVTITTFSYSQGWDWSWGNQIGTAGDEELPRLAVDNDDNVFVTTTYQGNLVLGDNDYPTPNDGGRDIVVSKYSAVGALLWSAVIAGDGGTSLNNAGDLVCDISTDDAGNAYIVGNLGPNAVAVGVEVGNSENRNFVAQIAADGTLGWITLADDDYLNDKLKSVEVGLDGNIYVTGNSGSDFDYYGIGGVAASGVESFIEAEPILIQLTSIGEVQWAQAITAREVRRIAFDQMGHIILSSYGSSGGPGNAGHYLTKINIESREEVWIRYAYSNTIGAGRSELGLHINADGSIVQFMTVGSATVLDYGDGVNSPGGNANRVGLLWHIGADGIATSVHAMDDQFVNAYTYLEFAAFVALDDDNYYLVGEINGDIETADGGVLSADPAFIASFPGKDILVLKIGVDGSISEVAMQTGTGPQTGMDAGLMSNGDVAICGLFDTPSHPVFGTGTTIFGDDALVAVGEEDVFVTRVGTGENGTDGLSELKEKFNFKMYPVPANDIMNVSFDNPTSEAVQIEISDITGKMIFKAKQGTTYHVNVKIPVDDFAPGIYLMRIIVNGYALGSPFVVN